MRFALIHSPAVGPSTWRWVAEALRSRGHETVVPDLVAAATTGDPATFAQTAVDAIGMADAGDSGDPGDEAVLAAHSGAGNVLPLVATRVARVRRVVFVDAGVPPCQGSFTVGGAFLPRLRALAPGGVLPPWPRWWGEAVLETLVTRDERRRQVEAELPRLPLSFFEAPISAPDGWCNLALAFIRLSDAYRADADRAASLGWPVVRRTGAHLDIVNDDASIADDLVRLATDRVGGQGRHEA